MGGLSRLKGLADESTLAHIEKPWPPILADLAQSVGHSDVDSTATALSWHTAVQISLVNQTEVFSERLVRLDDESTKTRVGVAQLCADLLAISQAGNGRHGNAVIGIRFSRLLVLDSTRIALESTTALAGQKMVTPKAPSRLHLQPVPLQPIHLRTGQDSGQTVRSLMISARHQEVKLVKALQLIFIRRK
jgi:hypothetical protein